jgi:hypothetical protein
VLIRENTNIETLLFDHTIEPLRLVVIGDIAGETLEQEFYSDGFGMIHGDALISVSSNLLGVASAEFIIEPISNTRFRTQYFASTGNVPIISFTAFKLEVYR